jgi:putative inorganic carbon (HCO3(-)) transporter
MTRPESRLFPLPILLVAVVVIGLPWTDGGRSPAGHAALVLILAAAGVTALLTGRPAWPPRPTPILLVGVFLIAASATCTLLLDRTIQTVLLLSAYLVAGTLTVRSVRDDPRTARALLGACLMSGLLVAGVGIVWLARGSISGLYATVLVGPFGYPNAMAGFLLLAVGAAGASLSRDCSRFERGAAVVGCVLFPASLYLTHSRGAVLAACVGVLTWALLERERWWTRRWLWGTAAALLAVGGFWLMGSRLSGLWWFAWSGGASDAADTSVQWRLSILKWTWAMIRDHPWMGVGPGAFPVALTHYQQIPYTSGENPHNLYLEIAAEYGLPAAILAGLALLFCLVRAAVAGRRLPLGNATRTRRMLLVATLAAFATHNAVDLDWSFPAIALTSVVLLGLIAAGMPGRSPGRLRLRTAPVWGGAVLVTLTIMAGLGVTRYTSALLVAQGRAEFAAGRVGEAAQTLDRARWVNPLSFSTHYWLAWTRLRAGRPQEALTAAEWTLWSAPQDPNAHALVGEIALAGDRWDLARNAFQHAVERAPAAQLSFHAGLVEASASLGRPTDSIHAYERALSVFSPERVLTSEARCLSPGDRYLLARMSRNAARLYESISDQDNQRVAAARAALLAQPDARGICAVSGRAGQTSPEAVIETFWRSWSEGGRTRAEPYVIPAGRLADMKEDLRPTRVGWIHSLNGTERSATVRYELAIGEGDVHSYRCTQTATRLTHDGWFLSGFPSLGEGPCRP